MHCQEIIYAFDDQKWPLQLTNPAMRRFACVFRACTRNVPKQRAKINPQMSALLSAEDAPERSGGAPQRIAGVKRWPGRLLHFSITI